MILIYTYTDASSGKSYVDFGWESETGEYVLLPNDEFCESNYRFSEEYQRFFMPNIASLFDLQRRQNLLQLTEPELHKIL